MTTHIFEASNISLDRPMVLLCDMDRLLVLLNPARLPTVKSINLMNVFSYLYCNKCKCFDDLNFNHICIFIVVPSVALKDGEHDDIEGRVC